MRSPDDTPIFNLKVVVQETGLKPDTLRAWERRYAMPTPQRTSGGHRLYSQRDIETLKWLVTRQEEGLSISRAVELWRRLESEGQDPLLATAEAEPAGYRPNPGYAAGGETLSSLRQAWLAACLHFNEQEAEQAVTQAFATHPPEVVCFDLLQKGLAEIGEGWYHNQVTVQQEHFASALALRRLYTLLAAAPPPIRPGRILAACPPHELHSFSLLLLTFLLRRQGWDVVYLGANVPVARLELTIESARPKLVVVSALQLHTAASTLEMGLFLQEQEIPMAYGGLIFNHIPELSRHLPGHFLGHSLEEAPQIIEQLMAVPHLRPADLVASPHYQHTLAHFLERQPMIESAVSAALPTLARNHLGTANLHLGQNIIAALKLGNIGFLDKDMNWLQTLLVNHQIPAGVLSHYLHVYHDASAVYMNGRGQLILDWLASFNGRWSNRQ
jgi:DNA-binding transcriptional MerR regulator